MSPAANPLRNAYFGELHVHTAWSLDAFVIASLNGPDEAFRFAKGEAARSSLNNAEETRLRRPLDFAAVHRARGVAGRVRADRRPGLHPCGCGGPGASRALPGDAPPPARMAGPATFTKWWRS